MQRSARSWLSAVVLAALLGPTVARADDIGIDLAVGRSIQQDGDRLLAAGLNLSWQPSGWWIQPELGYESKLFPLFGGQNDEYTAGLRSEWQLGNSRVWLGGGYTQLYRQWNATDDRLEGWYARAGAMWPVGRGGFHMGVEGKIVRVSAPEIPGSTNRAGSQRYGLLLGWRI